MRCACAVLLQAATAAVKSLKRQLQRCDQQEQVADMRQEITLLAESMSDCLQQVGLHQVRPDTIDRMPCKYRQHQVCALPMLLTLRS